jgi:hypothetical protein
VNRRCFLLGVLAVWLAGGGVGAQVVINEIHYHPVEKPVFDGAGDSVLELSDDVHEFIELKNAGPSTVALGGWRLAGGVDYVFPAGTVLPAGGHLVVARFPRRLEAVAAYGLAAGSVFGPWQGGLSNRGEAIRVESAAGAVADAVSYASAEPWPLAAHAFGAEADWTGIDELQHQYRGCSLERVSAAWASNDPANWLASPVAAGPSPGRANAISRPVPLPVAVGVEAVQESTGSILIRENQPVRIDARFSSGGSGVVGVQVEYFKDETNATDEARTLVAMTPVDGQPGSWRAVVPGQAIRSVVRYRIVADRGQGEETISPRPDDPYAWHGWFVTPVRSGTQPKYDVFVSSSALSTLSNNIAGSPRRIVSPDPPGLPRESWNATQPGVLVRDGRVIDVRLRHHGSRYNRNVLRASFKVQFPRYARLDGAEALFFKDKGDDHRVGTQLYRAAGLPSFGARYVDLFINGSSQRQRLEVPEMDERHFEKFAEAQAAAYPGTEVEATGEFYKATGVVPFETASGIGATTVYTSSGEGPYYIGNAAPIPAKAGWTQRQRYEYTYGLQMHQWIGGRDVEDLITGLWAARGDSPTAPNPNLPALRDWLERHFDVEATLRYIAIRNWCSPFDNATHNYFLWRRANGRWAMLPWDLDGELGNTTQSIFWDEQTTPQPDTLRGPQWIKDSFLKCFREEYRRTLWLLNHTVLHPSRFGPDGYDGAQSFATARHANVNTQLGFGTFHRPATPQAVSPSDGAPVLPGAVMQTTAYGHSAPAPNPAHAATTWIIRAAGATWETPVYRATSSIDLVSLPIPFSALTFGTMYYWKCVHIDSDGHPSLESAESSFVFGPATGVPPDVRISEVFARGSGPDFIELHNAGDTPAELGGMGLGDDPAEPSAIVFPAGTVLPAGGYRVVTLDGTAPFRLDGDGQTVVLTRQDGTLLDAISFGPQAADRSIGRGPNGWTLGPPTPGAANLPEATAAPGGLRLNEWMASNPDGPDWFEVVNPGAQPVSLAGLRLGNGTSQTILPALSFIGPGGFQRFVADREPGPNHVDFRLSSSGETMILADGEGGVIDAVTFGPQQTGVSEGRLPDASGPIIRFPNHATPGEPNALAIEDIVISRVYPDIELYNRSQAPVVVDGWGISDSLGELAKAVIPAGFGAVPAGGIRVLPAATLPFALGRLRGGDLWLSHSGSHRSRRTYGAWDGHSWGLVQRGGGDVFVRVKAVPATPLNEPVVGPVVVAEINYHPPDLSADDATYEFVEWINIGDAALDVGDWRLGGDAALTIPSGTVLPAGGRLVLAAVSPAEFLARYEVPAGTVVHGPWSGGLPNNSGRVQLIRRLPPITDLGPDYGYRPEIALEDITYDDDAPWPEAADGGGLSLVRLSPAGFGADAEQWTTGAPSPGGAPSANLPPLVTIDTPTPGLSLPAGLPITIDVTAADPDGVVKQVDVEVDGQWVATDLEPPFSLVWSSTAIGPRTLVVRAVDGRLATATASVTVTLVNDPPQAALLSPKAHTRVGQGLPVVLHAAATDPEGLLDRVEFLVDGAVVGTVRSSPWTLDWVAAPAGHRKVQVRAVDVTGLDRLSRAVQVFVAGAAPPAPVIAYRVSAGTIGNQTYGGSLGHDFDVLAPIVVSRLGVFDSGANGLGSSLTAELWQRAPSTQRLAGLSFTAAAPGELAAGTSSRFKPLDEAMVLGPGSYTVVAFGYSSNEPNGNAGAATPLWNTQDGGGLIRFTGTSRYGTAGQFPATADGGPADRYAGPTFEFSSADTDGDFMPRDWEVSQGMDPDDPADGASDFDGDGASNQEEYAAGTDPLSRASRPGIESVHVTPDGVAVRFHLPAQRTAVLQTSRELIFWEDQAMAPAGASPRTVELSLPAESTLFLRVVFQP